MMNVDIRTFSPREKAILIGLYLSKFNQAALAHLGFKRFSEAYNVLGYAIGAKPQSIKNYRDEFDPHFPNSRKGWANRDLREHCQAILDEFNGYDITAFAKLVLGVVAPGSINIEESPTNVGPDYTSMVANRLVTGLAAEEYFMSRYREVPEFAGLAITDMRNSARGFDFLALAEAEYFCVEVKGINAKRGNVMLTEKEHSTARAEKERYCLFVVSNFLTTPNHQCFFNPLQGHLAFKAVEEVIVRRSFIASIQAS